MTDHARHDYDTAIQTALAADPYHRPGHDQIRCPTHWPVDTASLELAWHAGTRAAHIHAVSRAPLPRPRHDKPAPEQDPALAAADEVLALLALTSHYRTRPDDIADLAAHHVPPTSLLTAHPGGHIRHAHRYAAAVRHAPAPLRRHDGTVLNALVRLFAEGRRAGLDDTAVHAWLAAALPLAPAHARRPDPTRSTWIGAWSNPDPEHLPQHLWNTKFPAYAAAGWTTRDRQAIARLIALPDGHPDKPTPGQLAVAAALHA